MAHCSILSNSADISTFSAQRVRDVVVLGAGHLRPLSVVDQTVLLPLCPDLPADLYTLQLTTSAHNFLAMIWPLIEILWSLVFISEVALLSKKDFFRKTALPLLSNYFHLLLKVVRNGKCTTLYPLSKFYYNISKLKWQSFHNFYCNLG